jgi:hypothetical protein
MTLRTVQPGQDGLDRNRTALTGQPVQADRSGECNQDRTAWKGPLGGGAAEAGYSEQDSLGWSARPGRFL